MRRTATILIVVSLSANSLAQQPVVDAGRLGAAYPRLVSFEAEPEIAAARFTVDSDSTDAHNQSHWLRSVGLAATAAEAHIRGN